MWSSNIGLGDKRQVRVLLCKIWFKDKRHEDHQEAYQIFRISGISPKLWSQNLKLFVYILKSENPQFKK